MPNKVTKRKIRAEETKKKLIIAAKQLAQNKNFENVSVDSIVEKAGVSKGAFYVHFESKDDLAVLLIDDYVNKVDLDYKSFIHSLDPAIPISDVFMSLIGKMADVIAHTIGCDNMKLLYKSHLTNSIDSKALISYKRDLYNIFTEILTKGVQQGEFRDDLPVDILARHCVLAMRGITFEWCIRYPDFDLREESMNHFKVLLKGILKQ